jgi:hypothetical protein
VPQRYPPGRCVHLRRQGVLERAQQRGAEAARIGWRPTRALLAEGLGRPAMLSAQGRELASPLTLPTAHIAGDRGK